MSYTYIEKHDQMFLELTWCHKISSQPVVCKFPDDKLVMLTIDWAIFCVICNYNKPQLRPFSHFNL